MGFLSAGDTLDWEDAKKYLEYVKKHGIEQFINIYENCKDRKGDCLKYGDEIEYILCELDDEHKTVKLTLKAYDLLEILFEEEENTPADKIDMLWRPEYANYMIEGTPGQPYGDCTGNFCKIEESMEARRRKIKSMVGPNEHVLSISSFPLLGVGTFSNPGYKPNGPVALSDYTPDEIITPHKRFSTLTQNIRTRRGSKVDIQVPVFKDKNTILPLDSGTDQIRMDSMAFGMGMCCLQTTFQCVDIVECRNLYDQLSIVSPIMLAITAGSPFFRGYLADIDARWFIISAAVDDRDPQERGVVPIDPNNNKEKKQVIPKSRYSSISWYISPDPLLKPEYNDLNPIYDESTYNRLIEAGLDKILARHYAYLFTRDPLVIYKDKIEIDDKKNSDHFENIQSTNWNTVRFKPPPPGSEVGWRVEFRPMELQITDFENAAFVVFTVLLSRAVLSLGLNFYIPLSKVDENLKKSEKKDAVLNEKFYFRKNLMKYPGSEQNVPKSFRGKEEEINDYDEYELMSVDEIMNGKDNFVGLIGFVREYVSYISMEIDTRCLVERYLLLIEKRASGELMTTAAWLRKQVVEHKSYKCDSVVSEEIAYDLVKKCNNILDGSETAPELLGDLYIPPNKKN